MITEAIQVFYRIDDVNQNSSLNLTKIIVENDKEVFLYDILIHFMSIGLGVSFNFWVKIASNRIPLESPSSVIPIRDGKVLLILTPSGYPPVIPIHQAVAYHQLSLNTMYSENDIAIRSNTHHSHKSSSTPYSDSIKPKESSYSTNYATNSPKGSNKSHSYPTSTSINTSEDPTLASIADAAKVATTNVKNTLFSFAQKGLKAVTEVIDTVKTNTSSLSSLISTSIQVGKYNVTVTKLLAEGGFGIVYLATDTNTSQSRQYALKKIIIQSKEQQRDAQAEINALQLFHGNKNHANIIEMLDMQLVTSRPPGITSQIYEEVYILFPYFSQGSAWDIVSKANDSESSSSWPFNERLAIYIVIGIAYGLLTLHDRGYMHRDVKPHNILIGDDGVPVLTDLGSVSSNKIEIHNRKEAMMVQDEASIKISAPYRCPELTEITSNNYPILIDTKVDIWALGCTLYCLAYGRSPFESSRDGVQKLAIMNGRFSCPPGNRMRSCTFSDTFVTIIKEMLTVNPQKRPDITQVISRLETHYNYIINKK